jgi:predicted phosphate transport protein (TIGR00153 family)
MESRAVNNVVDVLKNVENYVEKVVSIVKKLEDVVDLVDTFAFEKIRILISEAIKIDTEADNFRRSIVENLLPLVRDEGVRESLRILLRMVDHVSEWIKSCLRYIDLVPLTIIPTSIRKHMVSLLKLSRSGVEILKNCVDSLEKKEFVEAYSCGRKLEEIEEEADRVLHEAQREIIANAQRFENIAYILFLNEMLKSLEIATDYEEDAGDIIRSLSLQLSKYLS